MRNIIVEGTDASLKTSFTKHISANEKVSYIEIHPSKKYSSLRQGVFDLLGDVDEGIIYDRHIISLLAYHIVNSEEKEYIRLRSLFKEFLKRYKGSIIFFMKVGYSKARYRLKNRINDGKALSSQDRRILQDRQYFELYKETFKRLFEILRKINEKEGNPIIINVIDTNKNYKVRENFKRAIEIILKSELKDI